MLTFTRHQCRLTAFALLALFVSALGLMAACAVWCGPMHGPDRALAATGTAPKGAHSCCAKKAATGQQKPPEKGDCCAHEKAAKWAAVPDGTLSKWLKNSLPVPALLPEVLAYLPAPQPGTWHRTQPVRLVLPRHLPPKIPDLRVFLHSLIV